MKELITLVFVLLIITAIGVDSLFPPVYTGPEPVKTPVAALPKTEKPVPPTLGEAPAPSTASSTSEGYPEIIEYVNTNNMGLVLFSHPKHLIKATCDKCHEGNPPLFQMERRKGQYYMKEFFAGKACGACHDSKKGIAFSSQECHECHSKN